MRKRILIATAVLAACSSTPATDSGGDGPAKVLVATGDGQSAAPGAALPVPVAVVVQNSSGAPLSGVAVTFTVDSGGGSLSQTAATTDANGTASAGTWTLGAAPGTNVVTAHVGSLKAGFHAQGLGNESRPIITGSTLTASGGTLQYQKAGDPLNGLAITVPAAAYTTPTQWTVTADSSVPVPLPQDVSQLGPTLIISNGEGYADSVMTLTMPLHADPSMVVAPFYFDPGTGTLEGIPVVAQTDSSITLAARHFTGDLMAIPGRAAGGSVRAALHAGFGSVRIVWTQVPASKLEGTFSSGFSIGTDNWEFPNFGDYASPNGDCEGMSITSMYYYYFVRPTASGPLYHHFDISLDNPWDNVQGMRFVGSVQADYAEGFEQGVDQEAALAEKGQEKGVTTSMLTPEWIALTIKVTHQPVLVSLYGNIGGHAVVATAVTTSGSTATVKFADPNFPTTPRYMTFDDGVLEPVTLRLNVESSDDNSFNTAYAIGVTAELPLAQIDYRWSEFLLKNAGVDRYPANYTLEYYVSSTDSWTEVGDTIRTPETPLQIRFRCPDCKPLFNAVPTDLQFVRVYDETGNTRLDNGHAPASVDLDPGVTTFVAVARASSPYGTPPDTMGFVDSRNIVVLYHGVVLQPTQIKDKVDSTYQFTASNGGLGTAKTRYVWQFGDGTDSVVTIGDSTVMHQFPGPGDYTPTVTTYDSTGGARLAQSSSKVSVTVTVIRGIWSMSDATVSDNLSETLDSTDDQAAQRTVNEAMSDITGTPSSTLIFVVDSADCRAIIAERFTGPVSLTLVPGATKYALGGSCKSNPQIFLGSVSVVGPIGNGSLFGSVGEGAFQSIAWSDVPSAATSIEAAMGGGQLAGNIYFTVDYYEGAAEYTLSFTATQVYPAPGAGLRAALRRR